MLKNRYHSMPDDKMLELKKYQKEYQEKYRGMKKAQSNLAKNAVLTPRKTLNILLLHEYILQA